MLGVIHVYKGRCVPVLGTSYRIADIIAIITMYLLVRRVGPFVVHLIISIDIYLSSITSSY
ncbi:hypothetical protein M434DRAFT_169328 [Hypoxylon sp. CO27-5]|nr:hypothetical protein M434DRAFT_169328 [Hypoxylon sp. CO27-5]